MGVSEEDDEEMQTEWENPFSQFPVVCSPTQVPWPQESSTQASLWLKKIILKDKERLSNNNNLF